MGCRVMLYFATSILVCYYVPELCNSGTFACLSHVAILERNRIVRLYNCGTRFLPELLLQFWNVPELSVNYFIIAF